MAKITKLREGTSALTDKQLVLIGRVAAGFALVESAAIGIAAQLTTPIQPRGIVAVSGGRFEELLKKIKDLSVLSAGDEGLVPALEEWTIRALKAQRDRDRVLHTPWFVEPSLQSLLGVKMGRRSGRTVDVSRLTNQELAGMADSIQLVSQDGFDLLGRVGRLPTTA